jgi:hypothetical protein
VWRGRARGVCSVRDLVRELLCVDGLTVEVTDVQRFFLCGRLIFGPDVRSLAVTVFLIVAPAVCFCVFVGRHLLHHFANHAGIAIVAVTVVYTVYVSPTLGPGRGGCNARFPSSSGTMGCARV